MKKLLFILALLDGIAMLARGEGTIQFANTLLSRVTIQNADGSTQNLPASADAYFAVYFKPSLESDWLGPVLPLGRPSTIRDGLISVPNGNVYSISGTEQSQFIDMQIYAWIGFGEDPFVAWQAGARTTSTDIRTVQLGPEFGPGTVIWQSATGTNPNRFNPLTFGLANPAPPVVPEPSAFAIAGLSGVLLLLWRVRRSRKENL